MGIFFPGDINTLTGKIVNVVPVFDLVQICERTVIFGSHFYRPQRSFLDINIWGSHCNGRTHGPVSCIGFGNALGPVIIISCRRDDFIGYIWRNKNKSRVDSRNKKMTFRTRLVHYWYTFRAPFALHVTRKVCKSFAKCFQYGEFID